MPSTDDPSFLGIGVGVPVIGRVYYRAVVKTADLSIRGQGVEEALISEISKASQDWDGMEEGFRV